MSRRHISLYLMISIYALISWQCTVQPTAGTETGNPDITACLSHAFTLLETGDNSLPSVYLPEGETQLNPERVYNEPGPISIAKKRSGEQDTTDNTAETDPSTMTNTIIIIDTTYIFDTIVVEYVANDTLRTSDEWGVDAGEIIRETKHYDSLFVVDTVITRDTVTFTSPPTTMHNDSDESIITYTSYSTSDAIPDSLYTIVTSEDIKGRVSTVDTAIDTWKIYVLERDSNYLFPEVRSDSIAIRIGRSYTSQNLLVAEMYYDNDGDGYLSAAGGLQQCTGMFHYQNNAVEWNIEVDFDAGADMLYSSTNDNRIDALYLTRTLDGTPFETVRYGRKYFGTNGDSLFLVHSCSAASADISNSISRYSFITGVDPKDHRQNRIVRYSEVVNFNHSEMKKAEYELSPDVPLIPGNSLNNATLRIAIDFGKGLTGLVEAEIDFRSKSISGMYAIAGNEYRLEFSEGDKSPQLASVQ